MFGFGSSSSDSTAAAGEPGKAPSREQRQKCWAARDAFFACLDKNGVLQPSDDKGGACEAAKKEYEGACGKSWIDYFNKRRVLEARQAATLAEAARQREEAAKR